MDRADLPEKNMDFDEESKQRTGKKKKGKGKKSTKVIKSEETIVKKDETEPASMDAAPEMAFPPTFSVSEIKNKQRRHVMFMKYKQEKRKVDHGDSLMMSFSSITYVCWFGTKSVMVLLLCDVPQPLEANA